MEAEAKPKESLRDRKRPWVFLQPSLHPFFLHGVSTYFLSLMKDDKILWKLAVKVFIDPLYVRHVAISNVWTGA